jgi:hypothetical protein
MIQRLLGIGVVLTWLLSMAWLVHHDIISGWLARDVPKFDAGAWLTDDKLNSQARIEDKYGHRVGTVWSMHTRGINGLSRQDVFWLTKVATIPTNVRIEIDSDFTNEGTLDEFHLRVFGLGRRIELEGEDYSGSLAFRLWIDREHQLFKVDASSLGMISDTFRPFPTLPNVEVGQSWRMHAINPLAVISGVGSKLIPMLVKVTGKEFISTPEGPGECGVVKTDRARAWVDAEGVVLRQEMDLPVGGTLSIIAEPYDEDELGRVRSLDLPSGMSW